MKKIDKKAIRQQMASLRSERKDWLAGRPDYWGMPRCASPRGPYCQGPLCEGCSFVAYCRERAAEFTDQIKRLAELLNPTPVLEGVVVSKDTVEQGALW